MFCETKSNIQYLNSLNFYVIRIIHDWKLPLPFARSNRFCWCIVSFHKNIIIVYLKYAQISKFRNFRRTSGWNETSTIPDAIDRVNWTFLIQNGNNFSMRISKRDIRVITYSWFLTRVRSTSLCRMHCDRPIVTKHAESYAGKLSQTRVFGARYKVQSIASRSNVYRPLASKIRSIVTLSRR